MDFAQLSSADRDGSDLSSSRESRRPARGADVGNVSGYIDRTGRARGRLLYDSCGRSASLYSVDGQAPDGNCQPGRIDPGEVVPCASSREFPLYALRRNSLDDAQGTTSPGSIRPG